MLARQFCLQRCHRFRVRHSLICEVTLELLRCDPIQSLYWFVIEESINTDHTRIRI